MKWKIGNSPVPYPDALAWMDARAKAIRAGQAEECVWLLEHPPCYTAGTSARAGDLLNSCFPVYYTGRGGQYTYHGPGQLVAYVLLDLKKRYAPSVPDVRDFVQRLERWIIATLGHFSVVGELREGRIGVWVEMPSHPISPPQGGRGKLMLRVSEREAGEGGNLSHRENPISARASGEGAKEAKIAALGVRISQGVSTHGIAINVNPDLSHYEGIVPCGIRGHGVTSLEALGREVSMRHVQKMLQSGFLEVFDS